MSRFRILWYVIAAAIVVRLCILGFFILYHPSALSVDDSPGYIQLAENMLNGIGFSRYAEPPYLPESFRTPGYPAFLAATHIISGSYYLALAVQALLAGLTALFLFLIAKRLGHEKTGLVAATAFLFMPFSLLVSEQYLTQVSFTALVTSAAYAGIKFLTEKKWHWLVVSALLLPLAAYVRPIGGYLAGLFMFIMLIAAFRKELPWHKALGAGVIYIAAFTLILTPWLMRNEEVFGRFQLSSITPAFLYFYEAPAVLKESKHISFEDARVELIQKLEKETGLSSGDDAFTNFSPFSEKVMRKAEQVILADPRAFIITRFELGFSFFTRDGIRYFFEAMGAPADYAHRNEFRLPIIAERAVLLLFFVGFLTYTVVCVWRFRQTTASEWLLIFTVLYFAALTGSMASAGLRYPAEPLFLLMGTLGLVEVYTKVISPYIKKHL